MIVQRGRRIEMEYTLSILNGELLESSQDRGPISYVHGTGAMLPGLERRLEGLSAGDEKDGVIPAEEAYGTLDTLPTRSVPKTDFANDPPVVGKPYAAKGPDGTPVTFTILADHGDDVLVRFDHPLAGKDIRYQVKILDVSDA